MTFEEIDDKILGAAIAEVLELITDPEWPEKGVQKLSHNADFVRLLQHMMVGATVAQTPAPMLIAANIHLGIAIGCIARDTVELERMRSIQGPAE